jgi:hypothetical protein
MIKSYLPVPYHDWRRFGTISSTSWSGRKTEDTRVLRRSPAEDGGAAERISGMLLEPGRRDRDLSQIAHIRQQVGMSERLANTIPATIEVLIPALI